MSKLSILVLAAVAFAVPVAASAQDAYTTRSVNVRGGPDTTYPPVAVLAPGAPVQVQGCLEDWSWCDVVFANDRGWVYAPYLNYDYQGARVPFYSYAPSFGIPIVAFSLGSYWDRYYRGRSFYGRRDYWVQRAPPQHFRPAGPAPRASVPSSFRERADFRSQDRRTSNSSNQPGFNGNRGATSNYDNRNNDNRNNNNRGNDNRSNDNRNRGTNAAVENRSGVPSRNAQPQTGNAAIPAPPGGSQEMRRASPTAPAGPPAAERGAGAQNRGEGNKGRGNEHEGGRDEKQR